MVGRRHRRVAEPNGNAHRPGKDLDGARVGSLRRVHRDRAYQSAEKNGEWLTMSEAATTLGVSRHRIRRLIKDAVLPAEQVVPGAPYQIRASDLQHDRVIAAIGQQPVRVAPFRRTNLQCSQILERVHNERVVAMPRSARSAALLVGAESRPSSRNRAKLGRRLSMWFIALATGAWRERRSRPARIQRSSSATSSAASAFRTARRCSASRR